MELIRSLFASLFVVLSSADTAETASVPSKTAPELPNPYKLDLRDVTEEEFKEAVAYGSSLGVTIVVYSAQEAPWKLSLDAANLLAEEGITVVVARQNDRDDNPQDAEVFFVAKQQTRDQWTVTSEWKTMFYTGMKSKNYHLQLRDAAMKIHTEYFGGS